MGQNTITYSGMLVVCTCWCGIKHAIPDNLNRQAKENGKAVFCPLGHEWVVRETETVRLRQQLENARATTDYWQKEREREKVKHAATKGKLTKTRNRISKGVCPCCNRSFVDLAQHMKGQHPEYTANASDQA